MKNTMVVVFARKNSFLILFSYEESDRFTVMENRQVICLGVYSQADELTVIHELLQATADSSFSFK